MLFDLDADAAETNNIAAANAGSVESLKGQLVEWIAGCDQSRSGAVYSLAIPLPSRQFCPKTKAKINAGTAAAPGSKIRGKKAVIS